MTQKQLNYYEDHIEAHGSILINKSLVYIVSFVGGALQGMLPHIPVVAITSMKKDQANNASDEAYGKTRQDWFDAHELLKTKTSDFIHLSTTASGHNIMLEEPTLVINAFSQLRGKL